MRDQAAGGTGGGPVRLLVRWLGAIIVLMLVLSPLFLAAMVFMQSDGAAIDWRDLRIPLDLASAWLSLVGLALALVVLRTVWLLIKALALRPLGSWSIFGGSGQARLVALGITVLIVPKGFSNLLAAPIQLLLVLADRLPRSGARTPLSAIADTSGSVNVREPVIQLGIVISSLLSDLSQGMMRLVDQVVMPETVIALGLWALIGQLLTPAQGGDQASASIAQSRIGRYLAQLSARQQYALGLTVVFLAGAYLSIAAMVAIPWLHDDKVVPSLSRESLEKALNNLLPPTSVQYEALTRKFSAMTSDPLAGMDSQLKGRSSGEDDFRVAIATGQFQAARREILEARTRAISSARDSAALQAQRIAQLKTTALNAFDLETATPMSAQERGYFIKQIQRSVVDEFSQYDRALQSCTGTLDITERELSEIARLYTPPPAPSKVDGAPAVVPMPAAKARAAGVGNDAPAASGSAASSAEASIDNAGAAGPGAVAISTNGELTLLTSARRLETMSRLLSEACEAPNIQRSVFTPPDPGTGWGPFGSVARWLLITKSFALTLVTGMLGFGLLGAVLGTLVRGDGGAQNTLSSEVISIVVRGLAAAIVVFLAVKGGLAVFSLNEAEPNAYVVFFTCLLGAVFSEDVWRWARGRFLAQLQQRAAAQHAAGGAASAARAHESLATVLSADVTAGHKAASPQGDGDGKGDAH